MGFVNAPAIIQKESRGCWGIGRCGCLSSQSRSALPGAGFDGFGDHQAGRAFFLFPKTPIADDIEFVRRLQAERVLSVPGTGFGRPGYIRLSYAVDTDVIERGLPQFEKVMRSL